MIVLTFESEHWLRLSIFVFLAGLLMGTEATMSKKTIRIGFPVGISDFGDSTNTIATVSLSSFAETVKYLNRLYKPINVEILFAYYDSGIQSFTSGVKAGLYLTNETLFNGTRIHGVIGGGCNSVTLALAQVLNDSDIAQISYASDASELSHTTFGEVHSRLSPSSSDQVSAMADMIYNIFNWRRVAVIYSTDTDGIDSLALFELRAEQLGITIIEAVPIRTIPGKDYDPIAQEKLAESVQQLVSNDARIFVLLIFNVMQAQEILYVASKYQLFSKDSVVIGNNVVSTPGLWHGISDVGKDKYQTVADILGGYIGNESFEPIAQFFDGFDLRY